jgi:prepilin-type N-terminal cleavage/methylation domain-containing protein
MHHRIAQRHRRDSRGFTLLELGIVVIIMGILVAFVVPSFSRVTQQNRVDAAAQYLRSIWSAQRVYWLENRTFADSIESLNALGLIDPKLVTGSDGHFNYSISGVTADAFTATATLSGTWSGTLSINQDGEVTGFVNNGGTVLTPPDI